MNTGSLTVLFEDPFWIGLFEMTDHEGLHVCKVTFGAEPTERELMEFINRNWNRLQFSQAVDVAKHIPGMECSYRLFHAGYIMLCCKTISVQRDCTEPRILLMSPGHAQAVWLFLQAG